MTSPNLFWWKSPVIHRSHYHHCHHHHHHHHHRWLITQVRWEQAMSSFQAVVPSCSWPVWMVVLIHHLPCIQSSKQSEAGWNPGKILDLRWVTSSHSGNEGLGRACLLDPCQPFGKARPLVGALLWAASLLQEEVGKMTKLLFIFFCRRQELEFLIRNIYWSSTPFLALSS